MGAMRAAFVLATILCLAVPQLSWGAIELSSASSSSMSLGSPSVASQIGRAIAKADKIFSFGGALAAGAPSLLLPSFSIEVIASGSPEPPNIDLDGPPLAPRPPPLS